MPHHHNLIRHTIDTVRSRVRYALAGETTARATVSVGAFLWAWLAVDRALEPPAWARAVVFTIAAVVVMRWLWRHSLSALFVRLPDGVIASWVERRHPELGESLLTALQADAHDPDPAHLELIRASQRRAEAVLLQHEEPEVVDTRRLRPWFWGAAALLLSFVGALATAPDAAAVYLRRLALSDELWPRRVVLTAERFEPDERGVLTWRVPRDTPLELAVRAELTGGHVAPAEVVARLRQHDGARSRRQLAAVGEPTTGPSAHQAYRMKIDRLRQDLEVRLRGGDASLGPLLLKVTARPIVTSVELAVQPPSYMGLRPYRVTADAVDQVPEGSVVVLHAAGNKPLKRVAATLARGAEVEPLEATLSGSQTGFSIALPPLVRDATVGLTLLDQDGIDSQPPYRLPIRVQADAAPRIDFALTGVGRVITPDAVLPTQIAIDDDHGVQEARVGLTVGERELSLPIEIPPEGGSFTAAPRIDLLSLRSDPQAQLARLEPGERLQLQIVARDLYQPVGGGAPHESSSQVETCTVVTADDLVARLEQREVNLRRTFEQTFDEARAAGLNADHMDDAPPEGVGEEEAARRRRLAMARLVEQVGKLRHDVASVGAAFSGIHQELINNRIQNDDLKERIDLRIVRPLDQIATGGLPRLERLAKEAAATLEARQGEPSVPGPTRELLGQVIAQMEGALNEMKAVETYNEVLALLRGIIDEQRELSRKTGDARKASLKRILLD